MVDDLGVCSIRKHKDTYWSKQINFPKGCVLAVTARMSTVALLSKASSADDRHFVLTTWNSFCREVETFFLNNVNDIDGPESVLGLCISYNESYVSIFQNAETDDGVYATRITLKDAKRSRSHVTLPHKDRRSAIMATIVPNAFGAWVTIQAYTYQCQSTGAKKAFRLLYKIDSNKFKLEASPLAMEEGHDSIQMFIWKDIGYYWHKDDGKISLKVANFSQGS